MDGPGLPVAHRVHADRGGGVPEVWPLALLPTGLLRVHFGLWQDQAGACGIRGVHALQGRSASFSGRCHEMSISLPEFPLKWPVDWLKRAFLCIFLAKSG